MYRKQIFSCFSIALLLFLLYSPKVFCQEPLGPDAVISLITCDPGSELYSTFGHTAIRVNDPDQNLDVVFNYGIFDFGADGFYLKFLRGKLNYWLGAYDFKNFMRQYRYEKRSVTEQILNLDEVQRQETFDFLFDNSKPENRYYKYDFFFDNCSTRPRDVFEHVLSAKFSKQASGKTFRDLLDEFLPGLPWSDFGIDLVIGAIADQPASAFDQTFLPDYLMHVVDEQQIVDKDLVSGKSILLDHSKERVERFTTPWFTPMKLFLLLLLAEILLFILATKVNGRWLQIYDRFWFLTLVLGSIIILFLWFATDHMATKQNWNILWMNPLYLFLAFGKPATQKHKYVSIFIIGLILTCLLLWTVIPQAFHLAFIPIMIITILKIVRNQSWLKILGSNQGV